MPVYGDITPRTAAYAVDKMLERAQPQLNMAKFTVLTAVPKNKTKVVKWRRYGRLAPSTTPLSEGVTPSAGNITSTDVTATLDQYGQRVQITDVIMDTHEDPVLNELSQSLGETAGQTAEMIIYNVIKAGTQVQYSNGSARNTLNTPLSANVSRKAIRQLKAQDAKYTMTPNGDKTKVRFDMKVDPSVPIPGFLLKRTIKGGMETATDGLRKHIEKLKKG